MRTFRDMLSLLMAMVVGTVLLSPCNLLAENHVVTPLELHQQLLDASQVRQNNLSKLEKFFSADYVKKALNTAGMNAAKVQQAASLLSDEELARLVSRTDKIQSDFAAGALNNTQITYILIALGTAIIVLLIVHGR